MTGASEPDLANDAEADARRKYSGAAYSPDEIMRAGRGPASDYFAQLDRIKRDVAGRCARGRRTLDLCCATGDHLLHHSETLPVGVGVDFSLPFLERARTQARERERRNAFFLCANARRLPFPDASFGCVYSFSCLYHIPQLGEALREIGRVLEPGGAATFDLGNRRSLCTVVSRAHAETAAPHHVAVSEMGRLIREAGLEVVSHRAWQILPMWGAKPRWLRPLLHPVWKVLLERRAAGRMLDEWVCRIPGVGRLAFRHLFVCRKGE